MRKNRFMRSLKPQFKITLSILALAVVFIFGCNRLDMDPISKRVDENFNGELTLPGNIDPTGSNQFTFMVMGDTHIGNASGEVMKAQVDHAKKNGAAFAVVAGDVTDYGDGGQYKQFKAVMDQFSMLYRTAIGNHDIFYSGWASYKSELGRSIYSFDADNVHIVMLDSGNGILGDRQLEWLDQDLGGTSQPIKIIVSHFPPWNGSFSSIYKMSSDEEAAILKDILHRHSVNIMFSGHYHGYNQTNIGGVSYIVTGGANSITDPGQKQHYVRVTVSGTTLKTEIVYQ